MPTAVGHLHLKTAENKHPHPIAVIVNLCPMKWDRLRAVLIMNVIGLDRFIT